MKNKTLSHIFHFAFFFIIILVFTHGLFGNFFQQDEWGAFGETIYSYNLPWWSYFINRGLHFSPFGLLFWLILYNLFKLQAQYYVFIELLLHALATFLVAEFISKITKSSKIGILTGFLFAINGRAYEAFMHLAIFTTTITSFIFIVLFFIYLINIKNMYFSLKNTVILLILFLCSAFFREDAFVLVPLFPIYLFVFDRKKYNGKNARWFSTLTIVVLLFCVLRFLSQFFDRTPLPSGTNIFGIGSILYNAATLPIKFIVQNIISAASILNFLLMYYQHMYTNAHISFFEVYPLFMDLSFLVLFDVIILIFAVWMYFLKDKRKKLYIPFFSAWLVVNALYLSFVGRRLYIVDERYLYLSGVPVLFFTSYFILWLFQSGDKNIYKNGVKKIIAGLIMVFLISSSYYQIQAAVEAKVKVAYVRRRFLQSVLEIKPQIPKNAIFYVQCKGKCHANERYGLSSDWVLPFSSGPGWNILVLYSIGHEKTRGKLFSTDHFLLGLNTQGYRKIGDYGFGYFTDKKLLENAIRKNKLKKDVVIALEYDEDSLRVNDITNTFAKQIR